VGYEKISSRFPFNRKWTTHGCTFRCARTSCFYFYDFNFDPITSTYEFDLDIMKIYLHTKNEVYSQAFNS